MRIANPLPMIGVGIVGFFFLIWMVCIVIILSVMAAACWRGGVLIFAALLALVLGLYAL